MLTRHRSEGVVGTFTAGGVLLAVALFTGLSVSATGSSGQQSAPAHEAAVEGTGLQCAEVDGTGQPEILRPTTAVIRTETEEVVVVPFTRGWDVHTGRAPGTLLAVCSPLAASSAGFDPVD